MSKNIPLVAGLVVGTLLVATVAWHLAPTVEPDTGRHTVEPEETVSLVDSSTDELAPIAEASGPRSPQPQQCWTLLTSSASCVRWAEIRWRGP